MRILRQMPAALLLLTGCDVEDWGNAQRHTEDFHHTHPLNPGGSLTLESFNGAVEIYGWDRNEVEVSGTKYASRKDLLDGIRIDVTPSPDSIQVRAIRPSGSRRGNMGARFRIHVPRQTRLERIESSNGGIRVEQLTGWARLRTSNGGIRLAGFQGDVEAVTSNGPVELKEFRGGARLETSNGPIRAGGVRGSFQAATSNGSIEADVEELDGNSPLRARTSNGPVRLQLASLRGNDVIAHTSNSSITLRLPAGAGAKLRAGTSNSSIQCDFELGGPITRSKTRLEGDIAGGGPLLDLETSNGPIRVERGR